MGELLSIFEKLEKARDGMTQKPVQVRRKGKIFTRKQWVQTNEGVGDGKAVSPPFNSRVENWKTNGVSDHSAENFEGKDFHFYIRREMKYGSSHWQKGKKKRLFYTAYQTWMRPGEEIVRYANGNETIEAARNDLKEWKNNLKNKE